MKATADKAKADTENAAKAATAKAEKDNDVAKKAAATAEEGAKKKA